MNEYGEHDPSDEMRPPPSPADPTTQPGLQSEQPQSEQPQSEQPQSGQPQSAPTWTWLGTQTSAQPSPYGAQLPPAGPPYAAPPPQGAPFAGTDYPGYPGAGYPNPPQYAPLSPAPPARTGLSNRVKVAGAAAALLLVGGAAVGGAAFGYAHSGTGAAASDIASGEVPGSGQTNPGDGPTQGSGPTTPPNGGSQIAPHHRGGGGKASRYVPPGHASVEQQVGVVDINTNLKYQSAKAAGTGMILTSDGEILTNNHVVEGATKIKVTVVATGQKYTAEVVGTDKVDDVAVLQLTGASGLDTITPDTDGVQIGDPVTAVGNAMGVGGIPSAAEGSVTGLNRAITTQSEAGVDGERLTDLIQIDAQVISGDSGGPLYDAQNEVIGMDTAASASPLESVGYAIPIAKALSIAHQIDNGQGGPNIVLGVPAFLGVQFQPTSSGGGSGAVVAGVVAKTPAADLGLLPGDVITSVSGTAITSGDQLRTVLSHYHGGDSVSLTWTDTQGGSHTTDVTLIDGPAA